jgi:hypothetical protein
MSKLRAAYHEMYLVTKNVYLKVLDCIDETSRRAMEELNRSEDDEPEERRPSEEFFDDLAYQDIEEGVHSEQIPIQESERRSQDYGTQRVLRPMLTYEPDLPPIREALRPSYGRFEKVTGIPTVRESTYPKLVYFPNKDLMEKQSEIIRRPQAALPPPRPIRRYEEGAIPRPIRRVEELREPQYSSDYDEPRPRYYSESSQSEGPRSRTISTSSTTSIRQRPPVRVSYQDEGLETIQDCARGVASSICKKDDQPRLRRGGGFQCELCNKVLSTKHSLNRHMSAMHKSVSGQSKRRATTSSTSTSESFSEWERPQSSADMPLSSMETSALPGRGERKRAIDEYETDEDVPLSKLRIIKASRKKKQPPSNPEQEPEGSGKKENFDSWE